MGAFSSAVERFSDKEEVDGPTPSVPTLKLRFQNLEMILLDLRLKKSDSTIFQILFA